VKDFTFITSNSLNYKGNDSNLRISRSSAVSVR